MTGEASGNCRPAARGPSVYALVAADVEARARVGVRRFRLPADSAGGRSMLRCAYQAALDVVIDLRKMIYEVEGC